MAIQWGSWAYGSPSNNGIRVGIDATMTTSTNLRLRYYTQNEAQFFDNQVLVQTGDHTGSTAFYNDSAGAGAQVLRLTVNKTVVPGDSYAYGANVTGVYTGANPTVAITVDVPIDPPAAPSALAVTRVSDTQQSLAWSLNATVDAPYESQRIERRAVGDTSWAVIATVGAATVASSDTSTIANRAYEYQIVAVNAAGSAASASDTIQTTPAIPTGVAATKNGTGGIVVSFATATPSGFIHTFGIERSSNGGAWGSVATPAQGSTSWTDAAPNPAQTHQYRVRVVSTTGANTESAWVTTETVQLATVPNPPSALSPNGTAQDATDDADLTWLHSSADTAPQSEFQVRHRVQGDAWTTETAVTSGDSEWTLAGATYANGDIVEWAVRTWGEHVDPSDWSATATITMSARPTATISTPGAAVTTSSLLVEWAYFQAASSAQAAWQVTLLDDVGTVLEVKTGSGAATSTTMATPVQDATDYEVTVEVRSAAGVWSLADSQEFSVSYLPPADVDLEAEYDSASGSMVLTLTPAAVVGGVTIAQDTVTIERRVDGDDWEIVGTGIAPDAVVIDTFPTVAGLNEYRVTVYSALPSTVVMAVVPLTTAETQWAFLNVGPGLATVARVFGALAVATQAARVQEAVHLVGRAGLPVLVTGEAVAATVTATAIVESTSSPATDFDTAARTGGVAGWRDPSGRRIRAGIVGITNAQQWAPLSEMSINLVEVADA